MLAGSYTYPVSFPSSSNALITVTKPSQHIWVIELHHGVENRLTKHFIEDAFHPALDHVEQAWRTQWKVAHATGRTARNVRGAKSANASTSVSSSKGGLKEVSYDGRGAVVITGNLKQDKFFCNGLDLESARAETGFFLRVFHPWIARLLTFPIPIVSAINGHAFAGGWILAVASDYRVMSGGKCWASMNEVKFGSPFPYTTLLFLRTKFPQMHIIRKMVLQGHFWTAKELLEERMIDYIVEAEPEDSKKAGRMARKVLRKALKIAEERSADAQTGVYGLIKESLATPFLQAEHFDNRPVFADEDNASALNRLEFHIAQRKKVAKL
ncbi:hypothetical protein M422DRAFT_219336 [Sphaerobolus stellatus SS14]|nr:hypothetical protein M422DRAFT_219336 [Sphaerobolus stellatus SS14]